MADDVARPRSRASSEDWHLVAADGESTEGGDSRAMSLHGNSRPQTPAMSAAGAELLDLGSDGPPTPEAELLADSLLTAPVAAGSGSGVGLAHSVAHHPNDLAPDHDDGHADVELDEQACISGGGTGDACGLEVMRLTCLQGLSQEGSLEGFALARSPTPGPESEVPSAVVGGADTPPAGSPAAGWEELEGSHLEALDGLSELLEGLGWSGGAWIEAIQAGLTQLGEELAGLQAALARRAAALAAGVGAAREQAVAAGHKLAARLTAAGKGKSGSIGLVASALGLSTLAALAGLLLFYMGRCRHLSQQLAHRDKELARLVVRVLNLQEVLQGPHHHRGPGGPHGPPVLRHTSLLSGLVASSLM